MSEKKECGRCAAYKELSDDLGACVRHAPKAILHGVICIKPSRQDLELMSAKERLLTMHKTIWPFVNPKDCCWEFIDWEPKL